MSSGNTSTVAIVGLIVIIVLLALYFYTDLSKQETPKLNTPSSKEMPAQKVTSPTPAPTPK